MAIDFRDNPFTRAGFDNVDSVVAKSLMRGRNGQGYEIGIRFEEVGRPEATLSEASVSQIRHIVDLPVDAATCVRSIAVVLKDTIDNSIVKEK